MALYEDLLKGKTPFQITPPSLSKSYPSQPQIPQYVNPANQKNQPKISAPVEKPYGGGILGNDFQKDVIQKSINDFFQTVISIPKTAVQLNQSLLGRGEYTPSGAVEQFILGKEPIKPYAQAQEESQQWFESKGFGKTSLPLAILSTGILPTLDLTGAGSAKVFKSIVKIDKLEDAFKYATKELKMTEELAKEFAPKIVNVKDIPGAKKLVTEYNNIAKTAKESSLISKETTQAYNDAERDAVINQFKKLTTKEVDVQDFDYVQDIIKRAEQGKVKGDEIYEADMFLKEKGIDIFKGKRLQVPIKEVNKLKVQTPKTSKIVYRTERGNTLNGDIIKGTPEMGSGNFVSFASDEKGASFYGKDVKQYDIGGKKILNMDEAKYPNRFKDSRVEDILGRDGDAYPSEKQIAQLKELGYDGLEFTPYKASWPGKEIRLFGDFNTKPTKSQLTDIYNQATKKALPEAEQVLKTTGKALPQGKQQISELLPPQKLSSLPNTIPETESAVNRIIKALKEAKPIRAEQEAIYSARKSQQTARIVAMGKKVPGEKGYFAQLGQLKGTMPKVQFEAIRKELNQPAIDELFTTIEKNNILSPFEKINAKTGLSKLLGVEGGTIPTKGELSLLNEIFPPEFVQSILEKRSLIEKIWSTAGNALNVPRAVMATADLSAPLRQGIFLIGRPKQWLPAFKDMFKYAFSEKAYQGLMTEIKSRPTYKQMRSSGLALTETGTDLLKREEQFMSNLVEKIPIFGKLAKGSNRAYSGFLNKLRADVFDDLLSKATSQGLTKDNSKIVDDISKFINSATGRGEVTGVLGLNRATVALNGVFFSPRLMASRLNLLSPRYYYKLDPFVRKEALKSLLTFTATAGTVLGLAKLGGADIGIDPRSADFGKIKVGDTRYDVLGGFQQYIVLASRLLSGQMVSSTTGKEFTLGEGYKPTTRLDIIQRFFESKTSPVASFALGLTKGETTMGEDFKLGTEIADRFIPMLAQDMFDLYRENGLKGLIMGLPGGFGIGSQTYSDTIPLESKTATGKPTVQFRQQPSLGETILNKVTGTKVEPIPVKATYDQIQVYKDAGNMEEAQKLVDALSENDYALYKKLKAKDDRIKSDETIARITPVYKDVRKLIAAGKTEEAQKIVDGLTDEEYKAYKSIKALDYKNLQ